MELHQIRYFAALASELHFLKAAKKSNISQPTLSQQIKKLEDEVGGPLFERSSRNIRLTPRGERFLPYAESVLSTLQKASQDLQGDSDIVSGTIRLGVIPTICPYLMPEALARLTKTAPRVRIQLYEETTSILIEDLKAGRLDMGILALPVVDRGVSTLLLKREPFFAAVSKSHPLASRAQIGRKDLLKERLLILQEGHCFGQRSIEFCRLSRQDPQVSFQGSSLASVMAMAELGQGVTFVPEMAVARSHGIRLKFIPLLPKERPYREVCIAWRLTAPMDKAQKIFLETVQSVLS
jgi:LysR family hydrogen peroxide-inducible transcriptional activator